MLQRHLAANALAIHERPVQAAEVAQDEPAVARLDDAMLLRDDLVEELNRIVWVAPKAIDRSKLDRLLPFGGRQEKLGHEGKR